MVLSGKSGNFAGEVGVSQQGFSDADFEFFFANRKFLQKHDLMLLSRGQLLS